VRSGSQGFQGSQGHSHTRIDDHDFLVIDEVATLLRCSTKTIRRHIATGEIPALKGPGGHFLVDRRVLLASLQPTAPGALSTDPTPTPSLPGVFADLANDLTT
jgi:excisionase family DNA binding protein